MDEKHKTNNRGQREFCKRKKKQNRKSQQGRKKAVKTLKFIEGARILAVRLRLGQKHNRTGPKTHTPIDERGNWL